MKVQWAHPKDISLWSRWEKLAIGAEPILLKLADDPELDRIACDALAEIGGDDIAEEFWKRSRSTATTRPTTTHYVLGPNYLALIGKTGGAKMRAKLTDYLRRSAGVREARSSSRDRCDRSATRDHAAQHATIIYFAGCVVGSPGWSASQPPPRDFISSTVEVNRKFNVWAADN